MSEYLKFWLAKELAEWIALIPILLVVAVISFIYFWWDNNNDI